MISKNISPQEVFSSRNNPADLRLGDLTNFFPSSLTTDFSPLSRISEKFVLMGYPDDEGIKMNHGRSGASEAPHGIRQVFYKMTPHLNKNLSQDNILCDIGNIDTLPKLSDRHDHAKKILFSLYQNQKFPITLGGGHDYGYPDTAAFLEKFKSSKNKPLVINFDAHLDVRPSDQGFHSGTPFHRILEEFSTNEFDFLEAGLQPHCNSQEHFRYLKSKRAEALMWNQCDLNHLKTATKTLGNSLEPRPCFISLDIDVFHSSEAPGCSQSWPLGLQLAQFLPLLNELIENFDVKGLGIYEVSPPLDVNLNTQRLAAVILHQLIFGLLSKQEAFT